MTVNTMNNKLPSLRQRIIDAWLTGMVSQQQLADRFDVSRAYVRNVLRAFRRSERSKMMKPIQTETIAIGRTLYGTIPSEMANTFSQRFEEITGGNVGLLMSPSC